MDGNCRGGDPARFVPKHDQEHSQRDEHDGDFPEGIPLIDGGRQIQHGGIGIGCVPFSKVDRACSGEFRLGGGKWFHVGMGGREYPVTAGFVMFFQLKAGLPDIIWRGALGRLREISIIIVTVIQSLIPGDHPLRVNQEAE